MNDTLLLNQLKIDFIYKKLLFFCYYHVKHNDKKMPLVDSQITPNLFHLRIFLSVYENGSFSKTAEQLGRSQPAVTQAINSLEKRFLTKLFHRTTKGITPTEDAMTLFKRAGIALQSLDNFFDNLATSTNQIPRNVSRHITSTQLNALRSVAEAGSFIAGASLSKKAGPTIHRAARDLEQTVNLVLFERTSFGIKPTKTAIQLARTAGVMAREFELALSEMTEIAERNEGNTAIGAMPMARSYIIPKAATEFKQDYPSHKIAIVEGNYEYLLQDLLSGRLDILIGASRLLPQNIGIMEEPLLTEHIVLLMSSKHPLASHQTITVADLLDFPWILPRTSSPLRENYESLFRQNNLPLPENVIECNSLSASRVILEHSDTLMLLSDAQARAELTNNTMVSKNIQGFSAQRTIVLQYRQDSVMTQVQQKLINKIRQLAESEASSCQLDKSAAF